MIMTVVSMIMLIVLPLHCCVVAIMLSCSTLLAAVATRSC